MNCTIYKNIFDKQPHIISVANALNRIKTGKSKDKVLEIRNQIDKERSSKLKANLPSICFSGEFKEREDKKIIKHSGFICLDFDAIDDVMDFKSQICTNKYIYACWVSPSGNGIKALVKIADGTKHRQHFQSLQEQFPDIDPSGINESRVCYESWDEDIFINESADVYKSLKSVTKEIITERREGNESFRKLLIWLMNKGGAFVTGERNIFLFKLASACCRFGISESETIRLCANEFNIGGESFSYSELEKVVKSAYRSNANVSNTATFDSERLIVTTTRSEVEINADLYDQNIRPKDVIFGEDVKSEALKIYDSGYESLYGLGIPEIDEHFKFKRGEITLLSGIGNYGKSTVLKYILLIRVIKYGEKFAFFSPEDNPAAEFYHDLVEIIAGMRLSPESLYRISRNTYEEIYDFVSKHIFYVYPKSISPTPEYIKERFLELIFKEKVDGCIIDPFNQMTNEYAKSGGRSDKYLETFLADCSRFAQNNSIYFVIVAHPTKLQKGNDGNYPCPDVFDIADGAMWNNKMDNILIYHRPNHQTDPDSTVCELHTKKIRRQKVVGKKGVVLFSLQRGLRRFMFSNGDYMGSLVMHLIDSETPPF